MQRDMSKKVLYIYAGVRVNHRNQKRYSYYDIGLKDTVWFGSKLWPCQVGHMIESERAGERSVKNHKPLGPADPKYDRLVEEFSAKDRAALETLKFISLSKKKHSRSLEDQVANLKRYTKHLGTAERRKVALWIYTQLL